MKLVQKVQLDVSFHMIVCIADHVVAADLTYLPGHIQVSLSESKSIYTKPLRAYFPKQFGLQGKVKDAVTEMRQRYRI